MSLYHDVPAFLQTVPCAAEWPALHDLLRRAAARRPRDWQLPLRACMAVGGTPGQALPAVAAVACLQVSILLIDDLLDHDPRGEYHRVGAPAAANLAAALQALGLAALEAGPAGVAGRAPALAAQLAALHALNRMVLATALGQHCDAANPLEETAYWAVVRAKSGPFYSAALSAGALYGGATPELAARLGAWGQAYGEMIQIHDDLNDSMATPASPDWLEGRACLPILFARVLPHPARARFEAARRAIPDPDALAEAQEILVRCGAISYAIDELAQRYRQAGLVLAGLPLARRVELEELLEDQIAPVRRLFVAVGVKAWAPGRDPLGWAAPGAG